MNSHKALSPEIESQLKTVMNNFDPGDGNPEESAPNLAASDKTVQIDVTFQDLVLQTQLAWKAIAEVNTTEPFLFRRGVISRIEHTERGGLVIREVTPDRMRHAIAPLAYWFRPANRRSPEGPALPPISVVRNLLATPDPPLPPLSRIVETPVFAPDGKLQAVPGYNSAAQVYYEPARDLIVPDVPLSPSVAEIREARDLILELIQDFPFVGRAERAHAVALLLLPFVRDLIDGPTPVHLVEKPAPGTGATLLVTALTWPAIGRHIEVMTEARDEDEWRKRITAKMSSGPAFILIDNLRASLDSAALSAAISARNWEDRRLGQTENLSLPVSCTWIATGNNPIVSTEIARRSIRIRLDSYTDRPWLRPHTFRHPDLLPWCRRSRGSLIHAALVLGQAWLTAGRPPHTGNALGMFEEWGKVIGGILNVAEIDGFLENITGFYEEADTEHEQWSAFVATWWANHGSAEVTVARLLRVATTLDLGNGTEKSVTTKLGKVLNSMRDRQFDQYRIKKRQGLVHGLQHWSLQVVTS